MPRRQDLKKVLIIGSGPIVIGQACEFDYSGTQACKVLQEEGLEVVLVNSNPATIMTDPQFADQTYIEPITPEMVEKIIAKERPDAILPTLGGQTGLNIAVILSKQGVLDKYGVELIGAKLEAIEKAEDRSLFKQAMKNIGLQCPESGFAYSLAEALKIAERLSFPLVVRPSFTLGGAGGGLAYNLEEFRQIVSGGLMLSPIGEVLIEQSVAGWKEFELEVMRDEADNAVIVCSIENFDPMGVHTGDSITVAPAQTLSDKEYQSMRNASLAIMREIGVETGGSNIQFAVNPGTGEQMVIEMNPRVSRSSALASKATGFPIAKIATKLAIGYRLDEIANDITLKTPACFEPTIDYVVVKMPRWTFEKFPETDPTLTTKMKSVGEAMAIGRTFKEALQKVVRSLEIDRYSLDVFDSASFDKASLEKYLAVPNHNRLFYLATALKSGFSLEEVARISKIDIWFIDQIKQILEFEAELEGLSLNQLTSSRLYQAKQLGFSDREISRLTGTTEAEVRQYRKKLGVRAVFKCVDTCAGEFEAYTPYYYSTYEQETEVKADNQNKVMVLGAGPNRIGQGIEFDYCCVHASFALKEEGYQTIMVNCNPETVSTDYDTSDKLYFEPLTFEEVMNIVDAERPQAVIVQFGGQTPLKLAHLLERSGVNIWGTSPDSIDLAEDRKRFGAMLNSLNIPQPRNGTACSYDEALQVAEKVGYPLLVRPSYVLGGRAMEIVYSEDRLEEFMTSAVKASFEHPVLIDKFLEGAIEVDVDAVCDGKNLFIGGIMEHVEEAGVHSGDSACAIPPRTLSSQAISTIKDYTHKLAFALEVVGLINIQFAVKDEVVYVLEVNPRASRTVPFVSKATGVPLAKIAAKVMAGRELTELLRGVKEKELTYTAVKEAVLPFNRFLGSDTILGPEMKSTGEVMGVDNSFGLAYAKSQLASGFEIPKPGSRIFISVCDRDKQAIVPLATSLKKLGFKLSSTSGTAKTLRQVGIKVEEIAKVRQGRPNVVDLIKSGKIGLIINTPMGGRARSDGYYIRTAAAKHGIPCITTMQGALAMLEGLAEIANSSLEPISIQDYYKQSQLGAETSASKS